MDCFQYVLYEKYNLFRCNPCHNHDKMHSRMHQIAALNFFFRDSILALAFSPHRGLDIRPLIAQNTPYNARVISATSKSR